MNKYDTILPRIGASVIDSLLMIPVTLAFSSVAIFNVYSPVFNFLSVFLPLVASALYFILMHTFYGQTLGKMAVKVKVLDDSEKPIMFGQSVARSLPQIAYIFFVLTFAGKNEFEGGSATLTFAGLFWILYVLFQLIDIALFLMNDKHRSLHDFLAKTVVVRTNV